MDFIGGVWYWCCGWIIIGSVGGMAARAIMGSRDQPLINDLILGVIGSFVGGIIVGWLGFSDNLDIGFGIGSLITAVIGAVVLIALGRVFFGRRR